MYDHTPYSEYVKTSIFICQLFSYCLGAESAIGLHPVMGGLGMTRLNGDAWEGTSRPNDEGWVSAAQDGGSTAAGYDIAA